MSETVGSQPHLVVVGGGIAGLSAAWQGLRRGARVTVVEGSDRFGGKVNTVRRDDYAVETGPDSFVSRNPALVQLAEELGIGDQVVSSLPGRRVSLLSRGRMQPMPAGMGMVLPTRIWPFVTTRILSWPQKLRACLDLFIPRILVEGRDESIGAFLRRRLGDGIVDGYAEVMVGGIYGAGVDDLSLDAVLPSLRDNERNDRSLLVASLRSGRAARRGASTRTPGSPFRSFAGGLGSLVDALVARLGQDGADLRLGEQVISVEPGRVVTDKAVLEADGIVVACGPQVASTLLADRVPAAAEALAAIPTGSTTVVSLGYPLSAFPTPPSVQGWLVCDQGPVSGVTLSSVKFADRAAADRVLLRAFVPGKRGPMVDAPDAELLETVIGHVREHLQVSGDPELVRIDRWSKVMPMYTVGHLDRVRAVDESLARDWPQLAVAGSALHGVGVPDCVADGRRRADLVLDAVR